MFVYERLRTKTSFSELILGGLASGLVPLRNEGEVDVGRNAALHGGLFGALGTVQGLKINREFQDSLNPGDFPDELEVQRREQIHADQQARVNDLKARLDIANGSERQELTKKFLAEHAKSQFTELDAKDAKYAREHGLFVLEELKKMKRKAPAMAIGGLIGGGLVGAGGGAIGSSIRRGMEQNRSPRERSTDRKLDYLDEL